jgi:hypothetical protein
MIAARDEEMQVSWACAAQSPDLLPEKYRGKADVKKSVSAIKAHFE